MTDDEFVYLMTESNKEMAKAVEVVASKAAGQLQAVLVVLRALQYQDGFDRQKFVDSVARYQAVFERQEALPDSTRAAFGEMLEAICKPL